ncbi:MAG: stage II sporulation protein M [Bacilli bacterium]
MDKKLNKTLELILPSQKINLFILFIIILGIISGSIFLITLGKNDKELVINQISTFMNNINSNNINNGLALKNALISNAIFISLIWIFGMSIIGIIFNIFLIYIKSFTIGFTVSSFILTLKYKGILAAFIYIFPSEIINILTSLILGVYSTIMTIYLIKSIFSKEKNYSINKFFKRYFLILLISIILISISSITESFLVPAITKLFIKLFIK